MEFIAQLVNQVNGLLWDELLIFLLCGTGIYYTLRLGFIQIRHFGSGFKALFGGISLSGAKADKQGMSSFQAVATAIAGQVGTGNLAGPATAIIAGARCDFLDVGFLVSGNGDDLRGSDVGAKIQIKR